jgi:hypothetical protein
VKLVVIEVALIIGKFGVVGVETIDELEGLSAEEEEKDDIDEVNGGVGDKAECAMFDVEDWDKML